VSAEPGRNRGLGAVLRRARPNQACIDVGLPLTSAGPPGRPPRPLWPLRHLLAEEDAWLARQLHPGQPVLWLRPQPAGFRRLGHVDGASSEVRGHSSQSSGEPSGQSATSALRGSRPATARLILRTRGDRLHGALQAASDAWPWPDGSLAQIVLQHVAEDGRRSAGLLAEAARTLAPEGRLYLLRYDRLSPWFWRHGRRALRRDAAGLLVWPLDALWAHRYGLTLEYRHALGARGFQPDADWLAATREDAPGWRGQLHSAFRATRVWVLRKRAQRPVLQAQRAGRRVHAGNYDLMPVRRQPLDPGN